MPAPKGDEIRRALAERAEELVRRERKALAELEEIRATIERLRREREAKIAEFRALTRPGSRPAPDSPATAPPAPPEAAPAAPHPDRAHDAARPTASPVAAPDEAPVVETLPPVLLLVPRKVEDLAEAEPIAPATTEPVEPPGPTIDLLEPVEALSAEPSTTPPDETVAVTPTVPDLSGPPAVSLDLPELPEFVSLPPDLPSAIELGETVALTTVVPAPVEPPGGPIDQAELVGAPPLAPAETPQAANALPVAPAPPVEALPLPSSAPVAPTASGTAVGAHVEHDIGPEDVEHDIGAADVEPDTDAPLDRPGVVAAQAPAKFVAPDASIRAEPSSPADATGQARRFRVRLPRVRWTVSRQSLTVAAVAATGLAVAAIALWSPWSQTPQGPGHLARPRQSVPSDSRAGNPAETGASPSARGATAARPRAPLRALDVLLVTSRPVWIRAVVDGRTLLNDTVAAGETITLAGNTAVTVRLGDAGAVGVWVNGENLGRAGRNGEVLTRRFDAGALGTPRQPQP